MSWTHLHNRKTALIRREAISLVIYSTNSAELEAFHSDSHSFRLILPQQHNEARRRAPMGRPVPLPAVINSHVCFICRKKGHKVPPPWHRSLVRPPNVWQFPAFCWFLLGASSSYIYFIELQLFVLWRLHVFQRSRCFYGVSVSCSRTEDDLWCSCSLSNKQYVDT